MQDLTAPGGKPGLTPWAPVTIGMGSKVLAAYELDGDASDGNAVLEAAAAAGGVAWKEGEIVDHADSFTAMFTDGSHGTLDNT